MIVYGDPVFTISEADAVAALRVLANSPGGEARRDLLIACGQLEQALADAGRDTRAIEAATDRAADRFIRSSGKNVELSGLAASSAPLTVKLPEGFAFYSLLPEQYVRASDAWLHEQDRVGNTLVVGVRSIGTSLSAVVQARLRAAGLPVRRMTVRPQGHPFQREVRLPAGSVRDVERAIVVDEGPGLSGSSIAAVVKALHEAGVERVSIFPSHPGEPGAQAGADVRAIWRKAPKFVFPEDSDLIEHLTRRSEALVKAKVLEVQDLSGGRWREHLAEANGAPADAAFERVKLLFRGENGRSLLWKFAGAGVGPRFRSLAAEAFDRQNALAQRGWCARALASAHGYIATEWIEGRPLRRHELDHQVVRSLARYLVDSAKPAGPANTRGLIEMTRQNCMEALGGAPDFPPIEACQLRYGDGRMAPHEWVRAGNRILKTDTWGHDLDHTCVGPQSILWDAAGALIEWEMDQAHRSLFLAELSRLGVPESPDELRWLETAYCSFRLGMASMCGDPSRREFFASRLRENLS